MSSPETVLRDKDTAIGADLYLSFELGDKRTVNGVIDPEATLSVAENQTFNVRDNRPPTTVARRVPASAARGRSG
jgi:hypothetical protein